MDFVLDSALNRAHHFSSLADKLAKKGSFDEAIENHELAITNLIEALKETNNQLALESIELQQQYHVKKQEILRIQKRHLLALRQAANLQKAVMSRVSRKSPSDDDETLQKAIYRTFEEADSLIDLLVHKKTTDSDKSSESSQTSTITGSKKPKDDSVVIEELRIVNCQLRNLITQLMTELASSERQVEALKHRIVELESGSVKNKSVQDSSETIPCSPDEFSVELPPLELPDFDT